MSIAIILLVIALVLFIIAAIGDTSRVNLTAAGLAFLTSAVIVTQAG